MSKLKSLTEILKLGAPYSLAKLRPELEKAAKAIKPGSSLSDLCLTPIDVESGMGLIQYLVSQDNDLKLLEAVIALVHEEKTEKLFDTLKLCLRETIPTNNYSAHTILLRALPSHTISSEEVAQFKSMAFSSSSYRFLANVFGGNIHKEAKNYLLEVAQNSHDLAYLMRDCESNILGTTLDNSGNNVVHLSLQHQNKNIFRYVIGHGGLDLLYQQNHNGVTPIDMVYQDIVETAEKTNTPYDFTLLMLLDQVGADLESEKYAAVFGAYQALPTYHHKFMLATQAKSQRKITAISFNGGGAKGAAFMSAYEEALKQDLFKADEITEYAGTSAGAITAGIFAMKFDIKDCKDELIKFNFKELMTNYTSDAIGKAFTVNIKRWIEYYQQGAYFSLISDMLSSLASESIWGGNITTAVKELMGKKTGIFSPKYLRATLERLIKQKISGTALKDIDPAHITFKDFKDHPAIFNALTVYITNLTTGATEKCSAETSPDMAVIDGIIHSASFPIFFEATSKHKIILKPDGTRERIEDLLNGKPVICCDGGIGKNDPVDAFDKNSFNEKTLTFMLVNSDSKKHLEHQAEMELNKVESVIHVLSQIYKLMRSVERNNIKADARNHGRLIYIDTKNVGTLDFDDAEKNAPILAESGEDAVIDYLHRRTANGYSILRPKTLSLLMSYDVAKHSASNVGQLIEINPGAKLTPLQILRVYALAENSEVPMLRSIINPNQRDYRRVTAAMIAKDKLFLNTFTRLQLAGANPTTPPIPLSNLPAFLNHGEVFLQDDLSDTQLEHLSDTKIVARELEAKLRHEHEKNAQLILDARAENEKLISEQLNTLNTERSANIALSLQTQSQAEEIARLKIELANSKNEAQQLQTDVIRKKEELKFFGQKYSFIRSAPYVVNAVTKLKIYHSELYGELKPLIEAAQKNPTAEVIQQHQLKSDEIVAVSEVIILLNKDNSRSAKDIIQTTQVQYQGFFQSLAKKKTQTIFDEIITAEDKISQAFGY